MIVARPGTASLRDNLISKQRVRLKIVCLVLSVTLVSLGMMRAAEATQDPPGCTTNAVAFDIAKDKNTVVNGDIVTYTITVGNGGTPACTAKNLVVQAHCPDSSGNPTIAKAVTVQNAIPNPLPVPQATFTYGTFPCTINVSSGVTTAQAQATLSGFLNDLEGIDDPLALLKSVSVNVVSPDFNVTKICTFITENNVNTVNFSGSVNNTGSEGLTGLQCSDSTAGPLALSGTSIPVGGSVTFSGSFTTDTSPHSDTVTCTAVGQTSQVTVGPRSATATCALPPPPAIPTLSGWVMILLVVFLALVAMSTMLRRKPIA